MDVCVGLIDMNPTQLEQAQTDIVCSSYDDLFIFPNRQKKMLIVESIQCHVAVDCTGCMTIQLMWKHSWHRCGRVHIADMVG
jgi:hypothetical protein